MNVWLRRMLLVLALLALVVALSGAVPLTGMYLGAVVSVCIGIIMVLAW